MLFILLLAAAAEQACAQDHEITFERLSLEQGISHNLVYCIVQDREGFIWFGTMHGLVRYDGRNYRVFRHDSEDSTSLGFDDVLSLLEDHDGNLWIGTWGGGLSMLEKRTGSFLRFAHSPGDSTSLRNNFVWALAEDLDSNLWIGTNDGVDRMKIDTITKDPKLHSRFVHFQHGNAAAKKINANVHDVHVDGSGRVWLGAATGLNFFDTKRQQFTGFGNTLDSSFIATVLVDRRGVLWVGTYGKGLFASAPPYKQWRQYRHDPAAATSLSHDAVEVIHEDNEQTIWVGTMGGLNRFDPQRDSFVRYHHDPSDPNSLSSDHVITICEDRSGLLWIGTYQGGIDKMMRATRFTHYKNAQASSNSINNNDVLSICEDDSGRIWIGTGRAGASSFDPATETFHNYDVEDGLQSNMFNPGACFLTRKGEMLFGGRNGFNRFDPETMARNRHVPPVAITQFTIFDRVRKLPGLSMTDGELELSYRDNFFTFQFAALDFVRPEKNRYAYVLEGIDADWIDCGTRNEASYTNVPPGRYTFRVKGSNNDGVWNEAGATVRLIIHPPFWQTWWFRMIALGTLAAILMVVHRLRLHHAQLRVREIEEIKSAEQLRKYQEIALAREEERERVRKKIAADFHDESGHKLTKISLFCGVLRSKVLGVQDEMAEYLDKIMSLSASLHKDMSDFLWALDPGENTLYDVAVKLKDFGENLFDRTGISFRMNGIAPDLERLKLSMEARQNLMRIFKEGMNNVLRHSRDQCTRVSFEIGTINGCYRVALSDDGKGFEPSNGGNGRGLKKMSQRAEMIGGSLNVTSTPDHGTLVEFVGELPG